MRLALPLVSRRLHRAAALALVALLVGVLTPSAALGATPPGAVGSAPALGADGVTVTVLSVTPSTPAASDRPHPLAVQLQLTNTTDQSLDKVTVQGDRGNPINLQAALDAAVAKPEAPDPLQVAPFKADSPVVASLGPRATSVVTYTTTSDTGQDAALCICQNRIYPLYFTVHTTDQNGLDSIVGSGQTYVPSFVDRPAPVQVSWIWPIMDAPHRLLADVSTRPPTPPVFVDDALASSVDGGRLDRVLRVVEMLGRTVPLTLVIDPELIDELAVMSSGPYIVQTGATQTEGTGTVAAKAWLQRLRAVLDTDPVLELHFSAFADPDVETLTRNGLSWTNTMSQAAQDRVTAALGGRSPSDDVAWPADGALSNDTLAAVVRQGAKTLVVSDSALRHTPGTSPPLNELAALQSPSGPVKAVITSAAVQRYVSPVLSVGGAGLAQLPLLIAELAIRAVEDDSSPHFVAIAAPRYVDPIPEVARRAIADTSATTWSVGMTLNTVTAHVTPADHGPLVPPSASGAGLPLLTIEAAQRLARVVPALSTMLAAADANVVLGPLPAAVQRAESSYWRVHPAEGAAFAARLDERITGIESGVQIVKPSTGVYTLASSNSPLPVAVHNGLPYDVTVRVSVTSAKGLPGFTATELGKQTIPAGTTRSLRIPTHVERTGRFLVQAVLRTPSGEPLGDPVYVSVRSTALGTIGVIITVAAAAVLVLALLVRFLRMWRRRGRGVPPVRVEEPVAVS